MDSRTLGSRICKARKDKKLTQEALAEKADISLTYMGEIERGEKYPSMKVFIRLVEVLDVSADSLMRDKLETGKVHVFNEITLKMENLKPKQVNAISELIDVYIKNL